MAVELRTVQYAITGGCMKFKIGQEFRHNDIPFKISHFKRLVEPGRHVIQIYVKPPGEAVSALWKEIVNGNTVIDFNVDFLCQTESL